MGRVLDASVRRYSASATRRSRSAVSKTPNTIMPAANRETHTAPVTSIGDMMWMTAAGTKIIA